jgi:hypothetical protein
MFVDKVSTLIYGQKKDEVKGQFRIELNKELCDLHVHKT